MTGTRSIYTTKRSLLVPAFSFIVDASRVLCESATYSTAGQQSDRDSTALLLQME